MNNLDKQYTDLIGDCYKKYYTEWSKSVPGDGTFSYNEYSSPSKYEACNFTKEEFINKIKTDDEFAKKWGLKIEERELSCEERKEILYSKFRKGPIILNGESYVECAPTDINFEFFNIPTKAISLTYNNQIIEIYE
jgi:hypothetical protein